MSENLVAYLRQRQGPVTAVELAEKVLKLQNVPEAVAARLITTLLREEKEIDRIGETAFVYRAAPAGRLDSQAWLICCVLPERANHWRDWRAAACTLLRDGERQQLPGIDPAEDREWPERLRILLQNIDGMEDDIPLLFSGFGNQISLFRQAWIDLMERPLVRPLLTMRTVAASLFPERRLGGIEELAAALGAPALIEAEIGAMNGQLLLFWEQLLMELASRGITSPAELAARLTAAAPEIDFTPYDFDAAFLHALPPMPGVYLMYDRAGTVIYVGKAKNIAQRVKSYFIPGAEPDAKLAEIRSRLHRIEIREVGSELEALLLEQRMIAFFDPGINRQIAVQPRPHRRKKRYAQILILPAASPEWLRLFFLDPDRGLAQFWLARHYGRTTAAPSCHHHWLEAEGSSAGALLRKKSALLAAVKAFFWEKKAAGDPAAAEIAWSWLGDEQESVHGIDMRLAAAPAEAVRLIEEYRQRLGEWQQKVIFT